MKSWLVYIIAGALLAGGGVTYFVLRDSDTEPEVSDTQSQTQEDATVVTEEEETTTAPDPQEEDIIRNFFQLIAEGDISTAVLSMSERNISDDSVKQAWGVQFADFSFISVVSVAPSMPDEWGTSTHSYQVILDVIMDSTSANAEIPYYGYSDGQNTRYVTIVLENDLWKVDAISTGP